MSQGHSLSVGEGCKHSAHSDAYQEVDLSFVPLVVETIGRWSEMASQTITSIGHLLGQSLGFIFEDTTRQLFQCLSISLWRVIQQCGWLTPPPPFLLLMVSYNNYNNNNNNNDNDNDSYNDNNNNNNNNNNNGNNTTMVITTITTTIIIMTIIVTTIII